MFKFPVAVSADWHIGRVGYGKIDPVTGLHTQTQQIIWAISQMVESLLANHIEHVFVVGDLFHKRNPSSMDWEALNMILDLFIKVKIHVHISPGNHEDLTTYTTALAPLTHARNPYIDMVFDMKSFKDELNKVELIMFSYTSKRWTKDRRSFSDIVEALPTKSTEKRICLCHEMIDGACVNNKVFKAPLSSKVLSKHFDLVVAGDVHRYQQVSSNVLYCGPIVHMDFGDRDIRPGYVVLNYQPNTIQSSEFILSSLHVPIKTRDFYQLSGDAASVWKELQELPYLDNVVKLVVTDAALNISNLSKQIKDLPKDNTVIVVEAHPIKLNRVRKQMNTGSDYHSQYTAYMKGDFDQDVISLGKSILEEACREA
jgi:DNA repair exonuclease SbcCD nuclease subunit